MRRLAVALKFCLCLALAVVSTSTGDAASDAGTTSSDSTTGARDGNNSPPNDDGDGVCSGEDPAPAVTSIPVAKLHNGVEMPLLSLGTAHLILEPRPEPPTVTSNRRPDRFVGMLPERTHRQIELALRSGTRAFDTALLYRSQPAMGRVFGEWFRTGRLSARNDIFVTSKVFHPDATDVCFGISHMPDMANMKPDEVTAETKRQFERSLVELNFGYVDLMLLHWPGGWPGGYDDGSSVSENRARRIAAWKVLEQMYERGWCRAIGVSNFSPRHLEELKEDGAVVVPMVNQIEASVTLQYRDIVQYCKDNGIVPQAYSPLGRGVSELPPLVSELASRYGKDPGQVAMRYLIQLGYAVTYLTNSPERMVTNAELFDFELTDEEMESLNGLNRPDGGWGLPSPHELW